MGSTGSQAVPTDACDVGPHRREVLPKLLLGEGQVDGGEAVRSRRKHMPVPPCRGLFGEDRYSKVLAR